MTSQDKRREYEQTWKQVRNPMPYFPIFLKFNGFRYAREDQKVTYDDSFLLDNLKTVIIPSQSSGRNLESLKAKSVAD